MPLAKHWRALGFTHIGDTPYWALVGSQRATFAQHVNTRFGN
jgi:hypothetical protein